MSLIEEAAKRLQELRRAGAEISDGFVPVGARTGSDPLPIPDAYARTIDGRASHGHLYPRQVRPADALSRAGSHQEHTGRRTELDFAALKVRGFITPDAPKSQIADEFRVLKRPIIRNAFGRNGVRTRNGNLIMVTSALPGEGKTFTSVNLALSIAMEVDSTVLLVDGDVAHPAIPRVLGSPPGPGLLDLLTQEDLDFGAAMTKTNIEKLTLLPAGTRHRRATELLASEQMASLLRELSSRYPDRIIIFDSPPLLATTEARVLATHMGQIIMVVAADSTSHHAVEQALATIESCEIVLMALNKARTTDVGSYYGYYGDDDAH
jgi:protein-tyrosine kinase